MHSSDGIMHFVVIMLAWPIVHKYVCTYVCAYDLTCTVNLDNFVLAG